MSRCYNCMQEYNDSYDMCPYCGYEKNSQPKEVNILFPGTLIQDRYEIGVSVGSGGFGITYKAWDRSLQKVVAVKEYYPVGLVNRIPGEKRVIVYSGSRERECLNGKIRFLEEARNMAKFNTHPNIVNVYDFFEENNTAYIIMEYLDGVTYKQYFNEKDGQVSLEEALNITDAVLMALQEVHKQNILHRDISPDNIFLCKDGKIKLIDFGAARFSSLEDEKTRSVILKPGYAPPEQYKTKSKQGPWTDIYAVGATMYRAITGQVPVESVDRTEEDTLEEPKVFCPELSVNINNAILRSMALLPELRFQSTQEFMDALHSDKYIRDASMELKRRKTRRIISLACVSVLVVVGGLICYKEMQKKKLGTGNLEAGSVSVWLCAENDPYAKAQTFEDALQEFRMNYPDVNVDIQCFTKDEYIEKMTEAKKNGNLPALFESGMLSDEEFYAQSADLSEVFQFISKDDYYYLDQYEKMYPSKKELPLSFNIPVVFRKIDIDQAGAMAQLKQQEIEVVSRNWITSYNIASGQSRIEKASQIEEENVLAFVQKADSGAAFLNGETTAVLADTSFYSEVEKKLAGVFKMEFISQTGMIGYFENEMSMRTGLPDNEKAIATQVLVYFLSDWGQDAINLQNDNGLPIKKKLMTVYAQINAQFEGIERDFSKVEFLGEEQEKAVSLSKEN